MNPSGPTAVKSLASWVWRVVVSPACSAAAHAVRNSSMACMPESPIGSAEDAARAAGLGPVPAAPPIIRRVFLRLGATGVRCGEFPYQLSSFQKKFLRLHRWLAARYPPVREARQKGPDQPCHRTTTTPGGGRCAPTPATTGAGSSR